MKKYLLSLLFLLVFTFPVKAQAPWDLIYHAIPISPSFDISEEIAQISGQVQTAVGQGKKIIMTFKTDASSLQSAIMSTFNKIKSGAILDIFGNPGQSPTSFCGKDVKKTKSKQIAKKVKEILLIAKSDDYSYITEQQKQREKFYMDNIYAIYAASLITQQEIENDIKAKIDKAKSCAEGKGGECGIPSTDEGGNNEAIFTYGKTLEAMDSVVRLWESVAALKARLAAVKMIYSITPALDTKAAKKNKQAFLNIPQAVATLHNSTPLAFAQKTTELKLSGKKVEAAATNKVDIVADKSVKLETKSIEKTNLSDTKTANLRVKFVAPEVAKSQIKAIDSNQAAKLEAEVADKVALKAADTAIATDDNVNKNAKLEVNNTNKIDLNDVKSVNANLKIAEDKTIKLEKGVINQVATPKALTQAKEAALKDVAKAELKSSSSELVAKANVVEKSKIAQDKVALKDSKAALSAAATASKTTKLDPNSVMKALDVKAATQNLKKTTMNQVGAAAMVKKESEAMQYVVNTIEFVSPDADEKENALASVQEEIAASNEMSIVEGLVAHAIEAHNFVKDLPNHRDTAKEYIEMQQRYKEAFDRLVKSEECAINYLNGFYTKPHLVWSGNLPLKNANKHELRKGISGWAFNAFELLKSGEAADVFEAFEAAEEKSFVEEEVEEDKSYLTDETALNEKINNTMNTSNTKPEEIAQDNLSDEEVTEMGDDNCDLLDEHDSEECKAQAAESGKKSKKKRFSEDSGNKTEGNAISDDKKKNAGSEARKSSLFAWQIGAEASKLLADEDWGSPSRNRKMVWTDTKRFYKKYLEKKYDNVLRHMSSFSEADLFEIIAKRLEGDSQKAKDGEYQKNRKAEMASLAEKAKASLKGRLDAKAKNREDYLAKMNAVEEEKKKIEAEINALNEELRATKSEINATKSAAAQEAMNAMQERLTAPLKFPGKDEVPQDTKIATIDRSSLTLQANEQAAKSIDENKDIKEKEKRVDEIQRKLADLVSQQMKKTLEIEKTKRSGQLSSVSPEELAGSLSVEAQLMENLNGNGVEEGILAALQRKAKDSALGTIREALITSNNENPIENFNIEVAMDGIKKGATALILKAQAEAMRIIIDEGLTKMYALGDELYMGTSYSKVQKIHDDMISSLKAIKLTFEVGTKLVSPLLSINDINVFAEFLEGVDTSPEKEGFFVGSTPKERDLQAPYSLAYEDYDLPPVREVFHFDAVDFGNVQAPPSEGEDGGEKEDSDWLESIIKKIENAKLGKERRSIDKEDFLNFGGDIPAIWVKMLDDYPFIESRLPLEEVLQGTKIEKVAGKEKEVKNDDCEVASFVRGGIMPCLYGDGKYYMDVNLKGNYVHGDATAAHKDLPPCSSIILKNSDKPYHTFWKVNLVEGTQANPAAVDCEYSELGMLFEADEHNNLYIKKVPFKNFNRVNRRDGDPIDKMSAIAKKNLSAARHSELSRNQIGDFLKQAENEKMAQESLDETRKSFEESKEAVYAILKEYGFVPSESFSLANKDDYKKTEKVIKEVKKQRIQKAVDAMAKIQISDDNKPAKEKSRNMNRLINFMNTDVDSVLKISMADAESKDLAIRLAKEIVNEKILGLFKKRNEDQKAESGDVEEAYCAIY